MLRITNPLTNKEICVSFKKRKKDNILRTSMKAALQITEHFGKPLNRFLR